MHTERQTMSIFSIISGLLSKMSAEFIQSNTVSVICPRCLLGQKGWWLWGSCKLQQELMTGVPGALPFSLFMAVMTYTGSAIQQPTLYKLIYSLLHYVEVLIGQGQLNW